ISTYLCPSDLQISLPAIKPSGAGGTRGFAQSSYSGSVGHKDVYHYWYGCTNNPVMIESDGMFNADFCYPIGDVVDGLSNTLFVGEASKFRNDPDADLSNQWSNDYFSYSSISGVTRPNAMAFTLAKLNASMIVPDIAANPGGFGTNWERNSTSNFEGFGQ